MHASLGLRGAFQTPAWLFYPRLVAEAGTIFLSYARAQSRQVEEIAVKLRAKGHDVFFDTKSLGSENYDERIRDEVLRCRLFVFFVSQASLRAESYARIANLRSGQVVEPKRSGLGDSS